MFLAKNLIFTNLDVTVSPTKRGEGRQLKESRGQFIKLNLMKGFFDIQTFWDLLLYFQRL